jgi:endonuclease G, mitochondrial
VRIMLIFPALIFALPGLFGIFGSGLAQESGCVAEYDSVGLPQYRDAARQGVILCRVEYILAHNSRTKVADWVMESLEPAQLTGTARRSSFHPDPELAIGARAELADYRGSGYDRGHLAPAGDMKRDQRAMDESFFLSNMAPQVGPGFNRLVWRQLEEKIRGWTNERQHLIVITGPVYYDYFPTIGSNNVVVPDAFYKVIFDPQNLQALGFILPNTVLVSNSYPAFMVPIRQIEEITGLNFLSALTLGQQNRLELPLAQIWP